MGASGAGKTSLMNAICDRIIKNKTSIITGDVKVNDSYKLTSKMFGSFSGYVM
jgi:ABC-type multidrug transport system ATPase subunit